MAARMLLVLHGSRGAQTDAQAKLGNEFSVILWGDQLATPKILDQASVILVLDATQSTARSFPQFYWSRAVMITTDPKLLAESRGMGYLGADKDTENLLTLVRTAYEHL